MKIHSDEIKIFERGNNNSQPIIFIHGFPFDHHLWSNQVEHLSSKYYCVSYDIRGTGESPAGDGQYTVERLVDDLIFVIETLKLTKPVVSGISMGGYIILRAIERIEDKFRGAILCDTKAETDSNEIKLKRAEGIRIINESGLEKFIPEFVKNCFSEEYRFKNDVYYKKIVDHSLTFNPVGIKGCLLAMAARTDTSNYLPKIKIPVLLLCGDNDQLTPPDVMKQISDKLSHSEFYIVPHSGHITTIENPEFVNNKISEFLSRIK